MRESKNFGKRTAQSESLEVRKKCFLVFEGKKTELIYFKAMDSCRESLKIDPLIELIPILRSYSEDNWSNPAKIVDRLIENIKESQENYVTYETLLNRIIEYFIDEKVLKIKRTDFWNAMEDICNTKFNCRLSDPVNDVNDACNEIVNVLQGNGIVKIFIEDITDIISNGELTYSKDIDSLYLIVDRDKDSFTTNQYNSVRNKCQKHGFHFCVTNPCFEFWLLLHFDAVLKIDKAELLENRRVSSSKRFVESELQKVFPRYTKNVYNAEELMRKIDTAMKNVRCFSQDIERLENSLGSNINMLIKELRSETD